MRRNYTITYRNKETTSDEYDMEIIIKADKLSKAVDILQDYYEIITIC